MIAVNAHTKIAQVLAHGRVDRMLSPHLPIEVMGDNGVLYWIAPGDWTAPPAVGQRGTVRYLRGNFDIWVPDQPSVPVAG